MFLIHFVRRVFCVIMLLMSYVCLSSVQFRWISQDVAAVPSDAGGRGSGCHCHTVYLASVFNQVLAVYELLSDQRKNSASFYS